MVSEGHQLASHTQNHENLNTLSAAKIADEISRTQDYITAAGGDNPAYIRPPYGNANKTVRARFFFGGFCAVCCSCSRWRSSSRCSSVSGSTPCS